MKHIFLKLILLTIAVMAVAYLVPGIMVDSITSALLAACFLSLINALIKPLLLILTFPITIVSLGFFIFFINGFCFWLASTLVPGFKVIGVWPAVFGALVLGIVSSLLNWIFQPSAVPEFDERGGRRPIKVVKSESRDI